MMRFLLDAMCGGLRPYLRISGYDTAYALDRNMEDDDRLLAWARGEDRILVTRSRDLAGRAERSILLEEREVEAQLRELAAAGVDLEPADRPRYCGQCNGRLVPVEGGETPEYAPDPGTQEVWECVECGQHFWKGSHWDDVRETLESL